MLRVHLRQQIDHNYVPIGKLDGERGLSFLIHHATHAPQGEVFVAHAVQQRAIVEAPPADLKKSEAFILEILELVEKELAVVSCSNHSSLGHLNIAETFLRVVLLE